MPKIMNKKYNVADVVVNYLQFCNYKNLSTKTIKSYSQTLLLFTTWLKEEKEIEDIRKVTKKTVEEYLAFTKERGKYSYTSSTTEEIKSNIDRRTDIGKTISNTTINGYLRNIKAFFSYLEDNCIIKPTEVSKIKFIKQDRKPKDQLSDEEYNRLIKAMDCSKFHEFRDYIITNLIMDTGMRLTETLSLTVADVDLVQNTIFLSGDITKSRKDRVVFFSNKTREKLRRWIRYKDAFTETELLFPTQRTNNLIKPPVFERNFRIYLKRAKIDKNITPHSLRNNFARRFLLNGGDIFMLSKILGHSSVTVTEKAYLDVTSEDVKKKYQRFSPLNNMDT